MALYKASMDFIISFFCNSDIPVLAHNSGLACLTILIPVAIAIFTSEKDFRELDNHVILDHVIRAKDLLLYSAMIFLPFFFWQDSSLLWRIAELLLWARGMYLLCKSLSLSYWWLKGNKFALRFDYLKSLTNKKDMEESWRSVWESDKVNSANEKDFFDIFSKTINQLITPDHE